MKHLPPIALILMAAVAASAEAMNDEQHEVKIEHDHQEFFDNQGLKEHFRVEIDESDVLVVIGEYPTYAEAKSEYQRIHEGYDGWGTVKIVQVATKWTDSVKRYFTPASSKNAPDARVYVLAWDKHNNYLRFRSLDKAEQFIKEHDEKLAGRGAYLYSQELKWSGEIWRDAEE